MADKKLIDNIVDEEEAYIPTREQEPIELSDEVEKAEAELEKIAPVADDKALKTKSMSKKILLAVLFIAVNIIAVLITVVMEFTSESEPVPISTVWDTFMKNWQWGALAILMFVCAMLFDSALRFILLKTTLKKNLPLMSLNSSIICKYYDNITPLVSGGQPFEVYYLRKKGIPIGIASGIPIVSYALNRTAYVIISVTAIAVHGFGDISTFLIVLSIIGLLVNATVPLTVFGFTILPKFSTSVAKFVAKIAKALHIVKDQDAFFNKMVRSVTDYSDCMRYFLKKSKINMLIGLLCCAGYFLTLYSIPYFTIRMCGNHSVNWAELFALCVICYSTITLIPTPGGAGGAELSFRSIFANFLSGGLLVWGMISWRMISYYSIILMGIITIVIQQIRKFTKAGKAENERYKKILAKEKQQREQATGENGENLYTPIPDNAVVMATQATIDGAGETVIETETILSGTSAESPEQNIENENAETVVEFSAVLNSKKTVNVSETPLDQKTADETFNVIVPVNTPEDSEKSPEKSTLKNEDDLDGDNVITPVNTNSCDESHPDEDVETIKENNQGNIIFPANTTEKKDVYSEKVIPPQQDDEFENNVIHPANSVEDSAHAKIAKEDSELNNKEKDE